MPNWEDNPLFRAILEQPHDLTLRLVFADWLDEHGDPDRAEFIRVMCELWRVHPGRQVSMTSERYGVLLERERTLSQNYRRWDADIQHLGATSSRWVQGFIGHINIWFPRIGQDFHNLFRRYPLTSISCGKQPLAEREWAVGQHAAHITTHGRTSSHAWRLYQDRILLPLSALPTGTLPDYLWLKLHGGIVADDLKLYNGYAEAKQALSDAIVAYGRESAGLPALSPIVASDAGVTDAA